MQVRIGELYITETKEGYWLESTEGEATSISREIFEEEIYKIFNKQL